MTRPEWLGLSSAVEAALQADRPVVALETAVATHGLPAPHHLEALDRMSRAIEAGGGTPAICLASGGRLMVGAAPDLVAAVASDPERRKASAQDLAVVLAEGQPAGLTVSATLAAAALCGIRVFATGGIGGVHLGATETGDVSADLPALAAFPVITVCAGAKSVLDLPRTLELLETLAVPVMGYRTHTWPAFLVASSGLPVPCVESAQAIARTARVHWSIRPNGGLLVGQPLPADRAIDEATWADWLQQARAAASRQGVRGKDVTPALLAHIAESSANVSVAANLALLEQNAALAAEIATALTA